MKWGAITEFQLLQAKMRSDFKEYGNDFALFLISLKRVFIGTEWSLHIGWFSREGINATLQKRKKMISCRLIKRIEGKWRKKERKKEKRGGRKSKKEE